MALNTKNDKCMVEVMIKIESEEECNTAKQNVKIKKEENNLALEAVIIKSEPQDDDECGISLSSDPLMPERKSDFQYFNHEIKQETPSSPCELTQPRVFSQLTYIKQTELEIVYDKQQERYVDPAESKMHKQQIEIEISPFELKKPTHIIKKKMKKSSTRNLRPEERNRIIDLYLLGSGIRQMSEELGMCRETVRRWVRRFETEGHLNNMPRSSQSPPLIHGPALEDLLQRIAANPFTPTKVLAEQFNCSARTVRRTLHRAGVKTLKPPREKRKNNR